MHAWREIGQQTVSPTVVMLPSGVQRLSRRLAVTSCRGGSWELESEWIQDFLLGIKRSTNCCCSLKNVVRVPVHLEETEVDPETVSGVFLKFYLSTRGTKSWRAHFKLDVTKLCQENSGCLGEVNSPCHVSERWVLRKGLWFRFFY